MLSEALINRWENHRLFCTFSWRSIHPRFVISPLRSLRILTNGESRSWTCRLVCWWLDTNLSRYLLIEAVKTRQFATIPADDATKSSLADVSMNLFFSNEPNRSILVPLPDEWTAFRQKVKIRRNQLKRKMFETKTKKIWSNGEWKCEVDGTKKGIVLHNEITGFQIIWLMLLDDSHGEKAIRISHNWMASRYRLSKTS